MNAARSARSAAASSVPAVSVFLPTAFRFRDGYLKRAVDSLLAQDFDRWELLAVDDGSTDGSAAYLADLAAHDPRIRHVRLERNVGLPAFTLALAWKHARAGRFAWLFDDCEWTPDHLSILGAALDADPGCGMAYGRARAELAGGRHFVIGAPFDMSAAENGTNDIPNVCVMIRREVIDAIGWYDPHVLMKRICDWDLWVRVARSYPVKFIDQVLAIEHGTSLPQSLGRIYSIDMALVLAYSKTPRNSKLHPAKLEIEDCYRTDLGFRMKTEQAVSLDRLLLEHAMLTANDALAERASRRMAPSRAASGAPGSKLPVGDRMRTLMAATTDLMRSRALAFAEREIKLDTMIRAALEAADGRLAEVTSVREELASVRSALDRFRDAADQRSVIIEQLGKQLSGAQAAAAEFRAAADLRMGDIERLSRELNSAHATAGEFRHAADRRMHDVERLSRELTTAQAAVTEFRSAADQRSAIIDQLKEQFSAAQAAAAEFRAAADERHTVIERQQRELVKTQAAVTEFRAAADGRMKQLDTLGAELASVRGTVIEYRQAADDRLAALQALQKQLGAADAAAQNFRKAADERLGIVESLQKALHDEAAVSAEYRAAADDRLELVQTLQREAGEKDARLAALHDQLRRAKVELSAAEQGIEQRDRETEQLRGRLDQTLAHGDELVQRMERMTEELDAARFRVDEARRVQQSLTGKFAFWLHRTLGR